MGGIVILNIYKYDRNFMLWEKVEFCAMNKDDCVSAIINLPTSPISATVGFLGVPGAIACVENEEISEMYTKLSYVAIDGMPIVKKCKQLGIQCERCSGPDIMNMIIREGMKTGKSHYFYGGKNEELLNNIKKNLTEKYPDINIVGMYAPPFRELTETEDSKICEDINSLKPDYVWVGIGQPKQDFWLMSHRNKLLNTTILGVGAAFDFMAGTLDRAPKVIQDSGLEWLYRFIKEPNRLWNRYVVGGFKYIKFNQKYKSIKL